MKPSRMLRSLLLRAALPSSILTATLLLAPGPSLATAHAQTPASPNDQPPTGWFIAGSHPMDYRAGVDRGPGANDPPSAYLKSAAAPSPDVFGTLMQTFSAADYAGKRIRLRASVRSQEVSGWAGLWMRVDRGKTSVAFDNMQDRPIRGTGDWKTCDVVLDVPADATAISFGVLLAGSGEVWISNVGVELVADAVPTTGSAMTNKPMPTAPVNLSFTR